MKNKPVETLRIIEDAEEDLFLKPEIKLPERLKSLVAGRPKPPKLQHIEAFKSEPKNIQVKSSAEVISESLQSSPSKAKNVKAQLNISETNIVTEDIQQKTNVIPVNLSPIHSPSKLNIPAKSPRRYMSEQPNHSVVKSQNIDSNPVKSIEEVKSPVKSSEHMSKPITIDSQPLSIRKPVSVQSLMVDTAESRDKSKRILPSADSISTESDTKPMRKQQILEITRPVESRSKLQTVELKPVESPVKQSSISKDEIPQRKYQVVTVESKSENEVKTPSDLKSNLSEVQSLEKRREQSSPISVKSRVVESIPLVDEIDSRGKSKSKSQREYPVEAIELGDSSNTTIRQMFDFTSEYAVPKVVPHYIDTKIEKGDSMLQDVLNTSKKSMIPIPTRANGIF